MLRTYYRADIDGLRAIAIIVVVFFHADIALFSGGFIGVDVFFVISGFLITSILLRALEEGNFSVYVFYAKRVRRLFPALLVVLSVSVLVGYKVLLFSNDFSLLGKSLIAQSLFASNLFFLRQVNYFNDTVELFPLAHTWSLSLEEQFYFVFPLILFLLFKFARNLLLPCLFFLFFLSFSFNIYLSNFVPHNHFWVPFLPDVWSDAENIMAAFYLLPTRAWELLVGSIAAVTAVTIRSNHIAQWVSFLGISLVLLSVFLFTPDTAFPGFAAALPVFGSAAIIVANTGRETFVSKLLAAKPMVWLGLISYSLYLWHWPLFVYTKIIFGTLTPFVTTLSVFSSVVLAWLTYVLVEKKTRFAIPNLNSVKILAAAMLVIALCVCIGFMIMKDLFTQPIPQHALKVSEARDGYSIAFQKCHLNMSSEDYVLNGPCYIGNISKNNAEVIVLGDSHLGVILDMLDEEAVKKGVKVAVFTSDACAPILGAESYVTSQDCQIVKKQAFSYIQDNKTSAVLLIAKWNTYIDQTDTEQYRYLLSDKHTEIVSPADAKRVFSAYLPTTIDFIKKYTNEVFILNQVPYFSDYEPRQLFYDSIRDGYLRMPTLKYDDYVKDNIYISGILNDLSIENRLVLLDPSEVLCIPARNCLFEDDGHLLYRDSSHLNYRGAKLLSPLWSEVLNTVKY